MNECKIAMLRYVFVCMNRPHNLLVQMKRAIIPISIDQINYNVLFTMFLVRFVCAYLGRTNAREPIFLYNVQLCIAFIVDLYTHIHIHARQFSNKYSHAPNAK